MGRWIMWIYGINSPGFWAAIALSPGSILRYIRLSKFTTKLKKQTGTQANRKSSSRI